MKSGNLSKANSRQYYYLCHLPGSEGNIFNYLFRNYLSNYDNILIINLFHPHPIYYYFNSPPFHSPIPLPQLTHPPFPHALLYKSNSPLKIISMNLTEWYGKRLPQKYPSQPMLGQQAVKLKQLLADAKARPNPCPTCKSKNTRILPKPPCDVFFPYSAARTDHARKAWEAYKKTSTYQQRNGIQSVPVVRARITAKLTQTAIATGQQLPTNRQINIAVESDRKVNHLTPKAAGGCPTGAGNLQPHRQLCGSCQALDNRFNDFQ